MKKSRDKRKKRNQKSKYSIWDNYRFVYSNMWSYDKSMIGYGIAEVIFNVLMPLGAVIIPSVVIGLLEKHTAVSEFIRNMVLVFLLYSIIAGIHSFLVSRNRNQYIDLRCIRFWQYLISKCLHMDYSVYESEKVREDMEKAENSIGNNSSGMEGFMHTNVSFASNIAGLVTYAAIISFVHPVILLLLLLISFIQLISFNHAKKYEHNKKDVLSKIELTQRYLQDQSFDLKAGKDVRLYRLNQLITRVYTNANLAHKKMKAKIRGVYYFNDVVGIVLRFLRDAVCYGYLIYLLYQGLEVSYFVLYLGIVSGFAAWFTKITENISDISRDHLMICDYRTFIDMENIFRHEEGKELTEEDAALDIVFDRVSFHYTGSDRNVLNEVSFHIGKGERFALVGINGAGKTTIVKLMCGFYKPTGGRIFINGIDMEELNIEKYMEQIAVIFQEAFVPSFTIGENVCGLTSDDMDQAKVRNVIELSGLKSKVDSLAKGTETYLNKDMDESGIQLSGGEVQKLMLARALYKDAELLILDEPTAALDAIAESRMYEQYQKLLKGRSSLFISHRLASTRFCNHILFLEDGRIIEEGSHDFLMKLDGKYAEMFRVQSQYYKEGVV